MATSALQRELRIPANTPVSYDVLSKLAEIGVREKSDLDFKQALYHPKNGEQKEELVKDVCAMANSGGGWIICGIAEADSVASRITGVSMENLSEADIHQTLEGRLDPPLTIDVGVHKSADTGKTLVALRVPDSAEKPHLVRVTKSEGQKLVDTKAFRVPMRKGASTVWLDERALRSLYRETFNKVERKEDKKLQSLNHLSAKVVRAFPGVALALILIPHDRLSGSLEKQRVRRLLSAIELDRFARDQGYSSLRGISDNLTVGDRRYIGEQTNVRRHAFAEIGFDGTIGVAIQLAVDEPEMNEDIRRLYTNKPDETTQHEIEFAIIEAFNCAVQLSNSVNMTSDSELLVCIVSDGENPIVIRRNEGPWPNSLLRPREESSPIQEFRFVSRILNANPTVKQQHKALKDLIGEVLNQGGIEQLCVLQPLE